MKNKTLRNLLIKSINKTVDEMQDLGAEAIADDIINSDIFKNYDLWNKELDIVHKALTELYSIEVAVPIIRDTLNKIDKLYKKDLI